MCTKRLTEPICQQWSFNPLTGCRQHWYIDACWYIDVVDRSTLLIDLLVASIYQCHWQIGWTEDGHGAVRRWCRRLHFNLVHLNLVLFISILSITPRPAAISRPATVLVCSPCYHSSSPHLPVALLLSRRSRTPSNTRTISNNRTADSGHTADSLRCHRRRAPVSATPTCNSCWRRTHHGQRPSWPPALVVTTLACGSCCCRSSFSWGRNPAKGRTVAIDCTNLKLLLSLHRHAAPDRREGGRYGRVVSVAAWQKIQYSKKITVHSPIACSDAAYRVTLTPLLPAPAARTPIKVLPPCTIFSTKASPSAQTNGRR